MLNRCDKVFELENKKIKMKYNNNNILVTGACGFIGFHLSLKLLQKKN